MKANFQAYAQPFDSGCYGLPPGITLSHTFVVSDDGHNWNCWGSGRECVGTQGVQPLPASKGSTYSKWASYLYGDVEGQINDHPANTYVVAGLHERYDGVCHNAANRLLVLAGPDVDVSEAPMNPLVILMYGKYGFNLSQYVQKVRAAAAQVNAEVAGSISQAEIDAVVSSITGGLADETQILDNDIIRSHVTDHINSLNLNQADVDKLFTIYGEFEAEREARFSAIDSITPRPDDFQMQFANSLKPVVIDCLSQIKVVLGDDQYNQIYSLIPQQAATFLVGGTA